jgi:tRNA A37 threonylcarbamoyladenosine synthetase subunit TsaC/SUA5/YrdC
MRIGCDIKDKRAIEKIYRLKKMDKKSPSALYLLISQKYQNMYVMFQMMLLR